MGERLAERIEGGKPTTSGPVNEPALDGRRDLSALLYPWASAGVFRGPAGRPTRRRRDPPDDAVKVGPSPEATNPVMEGCPGRPGADHPRGAAGRGQPVARASGARAHGVGAIPGRARSRAAGQVRECTG